MSTFRKYVKEMATHITDLPLDVVSKIISVVAKGPDGAQDVAKSMPTCKLFLKASKSLLVRKSVCFDHAQILDRTLFFINTHGLLCICAKSQNPSAEFQLAQIILTVSTRLVELDMERAGVNFFRNYTLRGLSEANDEGVLAEFVTHFTPAPGTDPTPSEESNPRPLLYHWEFVRAFLLKSTPTDIIYMSPHVCNYIQLFTAWQSIANDVCKLLCTIDFWVNIGLTNSDTVASRYAGLISGVTLQPRDCFEYVRNKVICEFDGIIPKLR